MENKTSKYFKYAIGEIVLVVIGILIALQINTWNENRKDILEEQKILLNLNTEFKSNLTKLDSSLSGINRSRKSMDSLLNIMSKTIEFDNNPTTLDSLLSWSISNPKYFPSSMVLKELESSGKLAKLKNQKLKSLFYNWNSKVDDINVVVDISSNAYQDCINYIKANGSLRSIDFAGDQRVSQTILSESNIHLLSDLKFENVLDDYYILLSARERAYKEAAKIMRSIIKQTESSNL